MTIGKVLVIEDQPTWQKQIRRALKGYELETTPDVKEAKQFLDQALAAEVPFHIVTLDISLQADQLDTSGEALLTYIKDKHSYLKCVVVSGTASIDQVSEYFSEFGVLKCFSKANFEAGRFREFINNLFHIGLYRLVKVLGQGAMGVVYQAQDTNTGADVALKVLKPAGDGSLLDKTRSLNRFEREAKTVQSLRHEHIVRVYDCVFGQNDKSPSFIVMEYLPGPTLDALLEEQERLPVEQVITLGRQLFDALAYAHRHKTIHRDIKPSNLIFTQAGRLKVTDFGIAKVLDESQQLTLTQEVLGTFGYMPPEQLMNTRAVDHRADIYAAGVVLYRALTGQLPYDHFDFWSSPLKSVADHGLSVQPDLEAVILQSLAVDPDDRPQNAEAVLEVLERI